MTTDWGWIALAILPACVVLFAYACYQEASRSRVSGARPRGARRRDERSVRAAHDEVRSHKSEELPE